MRYAINSCSNNFGTSASICSGRAIVAASDAKAMRVRTGKRLPKVEVPVVPGRVETSEVSVRGSLCERHAMRGTTGVHPTAIWQTTTTELPAAVWATLVLNRATSI